MTDKVQLIKQEIERLKEENSIGLCEYDAGYCNGVGETCSEILQFIDSLPEEFASVEENDCTTCINDKGCITCENGELHESINKAEEKALEAYPILFSERNGYDNTFKDRRESYIKGYDQAFKDFLKKAVEWLTFHREGHRFLWSEIEDFKKAMKGDMTNEKKARQLAIQSTKDVDDNGNEVYNVFVEAALLEMARWKDEQFSAIINGLPQPIKDLIKTLAK